GDRIDQGQSFTHLHAPSRTFTLAAWGRSSRLERTRVQCANTSSNSHISPQYHQNQSFDDWPKAGGLIDVPFKEINRVSCKKTLNPVRRGSVCVPGEACR